MNLQDDLARAYSSSEMPEPGEFAISRPDILTRNPKMETMLKMAEVVALHRTPVLIEGESGTGKELLARYIHSHSDRKNGPFVAVNCAAIPETLLESELFGYEKGAFTGAQNGRQGKFEQADGGTILLDEIGELAPSLQVKLLRVLQEYEVDRLGGRQSIPVNVRIIATTNRSLKKLVAKGGFREDLYFRINVFPLRLIPLRERVEDMRVLVPHFICKYNSDTVKEVDPEVYEMMGRYPWRGNIREMENVVARAVVLSYNSPRITAEHIIFEGIIEDDEEDDVIPSGITLREMEKRLILKTLSDQDGNRTHASKVLDISVRTLRNKLAEYRRNGELTISLA